MIKNNLDIILDLLIFNQPRDSHLKCLDNFVKKRNQLANYYYEFLDTKNISFQKIDKNDLSSRHLFIVKIKKNKRNQLMRFLKRKKIETNLHYIPIYKFSYYNQKLKLKNSEIYFNNAYLSIAYKIK